MQSESVTHEFENEKNLEEEAKKRRAKLAELRARSQQAKQGEERDRDATVALPKPVFRNYTPQTEYLKSSKMEEAKPAQVEEMIKTHLEIANNEPILDDLIDITNLAPRKIDWDLKRNISKKLNKVERRTKRAILEILIEKSQIENEGGEKMEP